MSAHSVLQATKADAEMMAKEVAPQTVGWVERGAFTKAGKARVSTPNQVLSSMDELSKKKLLV